MNTDPTYKLHQGYSGPKSIVVPVRMYSRNSVLSKLHIKSKRWLGVNLEKYALTFYKDLVPAAKDANPSTEMPFIKITKVEADISKAPEHKYYLIVHTTDGDLKFKFKSVRDFYQIVESLRNTLQNDRPLFEQEGISNAVKSADQSQTKVTQVSAGNDHSKVEITGNKDLNNSYSSVSSDEDNTYELENVARDRVRSKAKGALGAHEENRDHVTKLAASNQH